jgi:hypothetical protein
MMRLYLGTHETHWLAQPPGGVPLFVSHRRLAKRRTLPRAAGRWALDSGGFTELTLHGRWDTTPAVYAAAVRRYRAEIGGLDWAAPQDWMCEPAMLARTGLTIAEHQARTVTNLAELRAIAPEVPWVPVLQGWDRDDYLRCVDRYSAAGVDLAAEALVGLGSVCRRQSSTQIAGIAATLAGLGIRLHGFGVKTLGLGRYARHLASADSLAWSYDARRRPALPGHPHRNCANCPTWALAWYQRAGRRATVQQLDLWETGPEGVDR